VPAERVVRMRQKLLERSGLVCESDFSLDVCAVRDLGVRREVFTSWLVTGSTPIWVEDTMRMRALSSRVVTAFIFIILISC